MPYHRDDYNLPPNKKAHGVDYAEVFEETPLLTLFRVLVMQGLWVSSFHLWSDASANRCGSGWWLYLSQNTLGAKMYTPGTNHFDPRSPLFKDHERMHQRLACAIAEL